MIRFYCEKCDKELWAEADWDDIRSYTLEALNAQLICFDCELEQLRKDFPPCPECGSRGGHRVDCKIGLEKYLEEGNHERNDLVQTL